MEVKQPYFQTLNNKKIKYEWIQVLSHATILHGAPVSQHEMSTSHIATYEVQFVLLQKHALIIENIDLIFSCYSSACKYQISIYFDSTVTLFNFKNCCLSCWLFIFKNLNEFCLEIRTELPTISKISLFHKSATSCMYLCKEAFSVLTTIKSKYWSTLKTSGNVVLKYKKIIQDLIRYIKIKIIPPISILIWYFLQ